MLLLDVTAVLHPSEMAFFGTNSVHNLAFSSSHTSEASNHLMQILATICPSYIPTMSEASNRLMQILATIWSSYAPTGVLGSFVCILYDKC